MEKDSMRARPEAGRQETDVDQQSGHTGRGGNIGLEQSSHCWIVMCPCDAPSQYGAASSLYDGGSRVGEDVDWSTVIGPRTSARASR